MFIYLFLCLCIFRMIQPAIILVTHTIQLKVKKKTPSWDKMCQIYKDSEH